MMEASASQIASSLQSQLIISMQEFARVLRILEDQNSISVSSIDSMTSRSLRFASIVHMPIHFIDIAVHYYLSIETLNPLSSPKFQCTRNRVAPDSFVYNIKQSLPIFKTHIKLISLTTNTSGVEIFVSKPSTCIAVSRTDSIHIYSIQKICLSIIANIFTSHPSVKVESWSEDISSRHEDPPTESHLTPPQQVLPRAKPQPPKFRYDEDSWAWNQYHIHHRSRFDIRREWEARLTRSLEDPERMFRYIINKI